MVRKKIHIIRVILISFNIPFLFFLFERQCRQTRNSNLWRHEGWTICESSMLCLSQLFYQSAHSESESESSTATPQSGHILND